MVVTAAEEEKFCGEIFFLTQGQLHKNVGMVFVNILQELVLILNRIKLHIIDALSRSQIPNESIL